MSESVIADIRELYCEDYFKAEDKRREEPRIDRAGSESVYY